jgi:hypothetical protein
VIRARDWLVRRVCLVQPDMCQWVCRSMQRRTISLGMSVGSAATSIVAGRRYLGQSVSIRQIPRLSGRPGTQRAQRPLAMSRACSEPYDLRHTGHCVKETVRKRPVQGATFSSQPRCAGAFQHQLAVASYRNAIRTLDGKVRLSSRSNAF